MSSAPESRERKYLEWTPELVSQFWDQWADSPYLEDQYFTFEVGEGIANFLSHVSDLSGRHILDYGCGPGYLEDHLLRRGATVMAADCSEATVRLINERFADRSGWGGAHLIQDGAIAADRSSFDIITCIETIEHMFEADRRKMLTEFVRVLRAGGRVMVTTPNNEDLRRASIACPRCGYYFHTRQHLRSWSSESLTAVLTEGGFRVDFCAGVHLSRWMRSGEKRLSDYSLRGIKDAFLDAFLKTADRMAPRPFPNGRIFRRLLAARRPMHLVAIATKA